MTIKIDGSGNYIDLPEIAEPATPDSGYVRLFGKTDGIYEKDDAGNATALNGAGGGSSAMLLDSASELTISSGSITLTQNHHTVDTESDAGSDDLTTLAGGTANQYYTLRAENTARTVVIKHASNNIYTLTGEDLTLDDTEKVALILYDGTNYLVVSPADTAAASGTALDLIILEDQKTSGTDGGTATTGSWQTHDLNTEVTDVGGHASISSNQITLAAGTFRGSAWMMTGRNGNAGQIRLYNVTDTAAVGLGGSLNDNMMTMMNFRFTIGTSKTIELQYRIETSAGTDDLGANTGWGTEVYASIYMEKE